MKCMKCINYKSSNGNLIAKKSNLTGNHFSKVIKIHTTIHRKVTL